MDRRWLPSFIFLLLVFSPADAAADAPEATLDAKHRGFFKDYCLNCHNAEKQKGKVRLDDIAFTLDSVEKADLWQKILNSINAGEMPPEEEKQPDAAAKADFLDALSRTLVTARSVLSDSGGKTTMRRLNRREYKNTLRDLLGVDINVRELPADGGAGTFDTVGSSLFMSSDQFEQYLVLGRQALDEHFARYVAPSETIANEQAPSFKNRREPEEFANKQVSNWVSGFKQNYERYQQWTAAVDAAAALPENAALAAELRGLDRVKKHAPYFYSEWMKRKAFLGVMEATCTPDGFPLTGSPWANSTTRSEKAVGDFGSTLTSALARFAEIASSRVRWATSAEVEMSRDPNMAVSYWGSRCGRVTDARGWRC